MADAGASGKISRPMKYPYTFTAKVVQFPWKFYFTRQWIWKYYAISVLVCIPVFKKISNLGWLCYFFPFYLFLTFFYFSSQLTRKRCEMGRTEKERSCRTPLKYVQGNLVDVSLEPLNSVSIFNYVK